MKNVASKNARYLHMSFCEDEHQVQLRKTKPSSGIQLMTEPTDAGLFLVGFMMISLLSGNLQQDETGFYHVCRAYEHDNSKEWLPMLCGGG